MARKRPSAPNRLPQPPPFVAQARSNGAVVPGTYDYYDDLTNPVAARVRSEFDVDVDTIAEAWEQLAQTSGGFAIPPHEMFAAIYQTGAQTFYSRFDEALKNSRIDALAMWRDAFIQELMFARQTPLAVTDFTLVTDDPDDPAQQKTASQVMRCVKATRHLTSLIMTLSNDSFFGKYGIQVAWGHKRVGNVRRTVVTRWSPVHGDKINYAWDGTPNILIYPGLQKYLIDAGADVRWTDIGPAVFLDKRFLRERFILSEYLPYDADYLQESDLALGVHGVGIRGRLYFHWFMRKCVLNWLMDAMQILAANGLLVGYYPAGNPEAGKQMISALKMLRQAGVAVIGRPGGSKDQIPASHIDHFEPATVGFDIMLRVIEMLEDTMRRMVLSEELSTKAQPQGIGAGSTPLQTDVREDRKEFDARRIADVMTSDYVDTIIRKNTFMYDGKPFKGGLPFGMYWKFLTMNKTLAMKIDNATKLVGLGVTLSTDQLRRDGGFALPSKEEQARLQQAAAGGAAAPQATGGLPGAGGPTPPGGDQPGSTWNIVDVNEDGTPKIQVTPKEQANAAAGVPQAPAPPAGAAA